MDYNRSGGLVRLIPFGQVTLLILMTPSGHILLHRKWLPDNGAIQRSGLAGPAPSQAKIPAGPQLTLDPYAHIPVCASSVRRFPPGRLRTMGRLPNFWRRTYAILAQLKSLGHPVSLRTAPSV